MMAQVSLHPTSGGIRYGLKLTVLEQGNSSKREIHDGITIAEIGREIDFDTSILDSYHYDGWKPVHRDLLVVCAAVELADRMCSRRVTQWARNFVITVPVQDIRTWQRQELHACLAGTLRQLTGDDWQFNFYQDNRSTESLIRQRPLLFENDKQFAIAYSDGLDSRCVAGIFDTNDNAIRVRLSKYRDRRKKGDLPFDLIPFEIKVKSLRESSVRSRGFKFAAVTAIASHISDVSRILIPESGQGALGPVLLGLHNVYADYRNHPTFFRKMENFIKELLNYTVTYEQPRLWYTKGQTISAFLTQSGKSEVDLLSTRSCWQKRMNVRVDGKLRQCGLCAACLLRRMSMFAAHICEPPDAYVCADLSATSLKDAIPRGVRGWQSDTMAQYGSVGSRHLQQLADLVQQPDDVLRPHVIEIARATNSSEIDTHDKLKLLLRQHADEWRDFVNAQGNSSFLNNWTKGGFHGRFE